MRITRLAILVFSLFFLAGSLKAQDNGYPGMNEESEAILSTLDSLTNLHYFDIKKRTQTVKRLNKYGFRPEDVPTYDDSIYAYRINYLERDMPFEYNEYVKGFIDLYSVRKRGLTEKILGLSQYYFPIFEEALEKNGLPHSLKYLAAVESALNPNAVSRAGATGIWQFMYGTAKMYNLKVNYYYDERRDPYAATQAVVSFFKDLYSIYKDWMLVLAAYNCGPGNVNKAIRKSGGKRDYWAIRPYLPVETRGYVPAFIAVSYVMNFAPEHNLYPTPLITLPATTDVVSIEGPLYLKDLVQHLDLEEESLAILNPGLKLKYIPQSHDVYSLRLPAKMVSQFEKKRDIIIASIRKNQDNPTNTDSDISRQIVLANDLNQPNSEKKSDKAAVNATPENAVAKTKHIVQKGDNLRRIAEQYNVTIAEVRDWNQLPNNIIRVGQELEIFLNRTETATASNSAANSRQTASVFDDQNSHPTFFSRNRHGKNKRDKRAEERESRSSRKKEKVRYYTVRNGESLWSISQKTGHDVEELKKLNKLGRKSSLQKGQKIKLPKA